MATTKSAAAKTASKTSSKSKGATASRKKPAGKPASPKKRAAAPRSSRKAKSAGDEEVTIDRRRNGRRGEESVESAAKPAPALERRAKVQRRRQIDPTTCERD
ncbi:MAG: hypothetical protein KDA44_07520, partial [Planctomycetales bacterium]|nr:hypothetical protein [Planctomycetales bacterium]